jgi:hypothetical protein
LAANKKRTALLNQSKSGVYENTTIDFYFLIQRPSVRFLKSYGIMLFSKGGIANYLLGCSIPANRGSV